ncbi:MULTISPECIES: YfcC family protein [Idiomarinaceae]|uniref:Ion transporter superfamily protein YfcC n=3 Tax=Pseudidiomarina TaxID=2800384 RepID=A0A368V6I9_9GAMM|nr:MULTISPECIES: AbgT family transporter [Idiomarinaceae]MDX1524775.1 AbgT family transporter [Pseudidiomarina maritima]MRJ41010.1 YfcC family protein [Idiomarina sp. FeN1]NCU56175.1 YfcC family protein [Idiomarina sp. FenA--70]NCU59194.1 YfcC family protein [Idiomarina sp. FenBw--71]PWW16010.1 putative ion transporter superfamily protein YfcC [Pseudidiomarina maritima]
MIKIKIPHTLVLMMYMMLAALVLTWLIPAGEFQRSVNDIGQTVVQPGTYSTLAEQPWLSPLTLFTVIPQALADAQGVIFFVLLIGGVMGILRATGMLDALIGLLLAKFANKTGWLILGGMLTFGIFSALIGVAEEYLIFVAMLVALCRALKLDGITAMGILIVGYGIGYGLSLFNPFTLLIAQAVAEVPPASGLWYRLVLWPVLFGIGFHHVYKYAKRVAADPSQSLLADLTPEQGNATTEYPRLTGRHKIILLGFVAVLGLLIWGIKVHGWYLVELSALFLGFGLFAVIVAKMGANQAANQFIEGAAELTATALLIGFARSIAMIMEQGQVLDTVIYYLAMPVEAFGAHFGAVSMLFIQSMLNLFIPSGSGQAFVTMPIMVPIADTAGISRQIAVLAFQMGDGLMNMIVPTNPVLMGILGLAGVPYERWFKFIAPLMIKLILACAVAMLVAVSIGYQ